MNKFLYEITIIFWFLTATIEYLHLLYYWQLKGNRWDRFLDLLSTTQGKDLLRRVDFVYKLPIAVFTLIYLHESQAISSAIIFLLFVDIFITIWKRFTKKPLRRPQITPRSILSFCLLMISEGALIYYISDLRVILLLVFVRFITTAIVISIFNLLTTIIKKIIINKAKIKLSRQKDLMVIGITGSYGKTSTKEILYQMLSYKFSVIKTPRNINTDFGIARFINKTNFKNVDIFIVEMGAYKLGDLKEHCYLANPTIGILTAISPQHLSLFGSIENIQKAKYQLLEYLPKNGLAITNSDNHYCREYLHLIQAEVKTFGTDPDYSPYCLLEDITEKPEGIICKGTIHTENGIISDELQTKLHGSYNALNLAPCVIVAQHLGMTKEEIKSAAQNISNPENALKTYNYGTSIIIDDTYNSNPDGFKAALSVLSSYPHDYHKLVVTRGIIELGELSDDIHEALGGEVAFIADELMITTPDFVEPLVKGIGGDKYKTRVTIKTDPQEIVNYIKGFKHKKTAILLESRIPSLLKEELHNV